MRLWTVQPYCVYEIIRTEGIYRCNPDLTPLLDSYEFINAYEWISNQMKKRIGNPPSQIKYPVWAWYIVEGKHNRPDMGKSGFKVSEKSVIFEIEIPDSEVLLTDFDNWHIVLNDGIYYKASHIKSLSYEEWNLEADKEYDYYCSLSDKEQLAYKEKSWENIICYPNDILLPQFVQATFWEFKIDQIKKIWILRK